MERVPYWFYGKFTNMEIPLPEGSSNTLIIRFLWVTNGVRCIGTFRGAEAGTRAGSEFASGVVCQSWPVDAEVVERLSAPAENELQNVVKLFQRNVVRYRNQPGDERADFQQYDPECQAITTRRGGHEIYTSHTRPPTFRRSP